MDNYKIKVKDETESKEAQELFFELGYEKSKQCNWLVASCIQFLATDGVFLHCWDDEKFGGNRFESLAHKELTLPQIRDLVVLKRNDVKDANRHAERGGEYFITSDGNIYFWMGKWVKSTLGSTETLQTVETIQPQDPDLISGADALRALADGKEVEFENGFQKIWIDINSLTINEIKGEYFIDSDDREKIKTKFRLKPTTITVNAELPKPHKETQHNALVYAVTYEFKSREERNAFADKLRGTNS